MSVLPPRLEQSIEDLAYEIPPRELQRASADISARYRAREGSGRDTFRSETHLVAYAVTRLPAIFAAVTAIFEESHRRIPTFAPRRMLDLGAGPGTASWAAETVFPSLESFTLVERDESIAGLGRDLMAECAGSALASARWEHTDLAVRGAYPSADLIAISYALGELPVSLRKGVVTAAWSACEGWLLVIEPGTPEGYETAMQARDQLIAEGAWVLAPCPHELQCPMRRTPSWCHFAQRFERTRRHRIAKEASLGFEDEKFSFVLASRAPVPRPVERIIAPPRSSKAEAILPLCALEGLVDRPYPRREDKEAFRIARKARWGDLLEGGLVKSLSDGPHSP